MTVLSVLIMSAAILNLNKEKLMMLKRKGKKNGVIVCVAFSSMD